MKTALGSTFLAGALGLGLGLASAAQAADRSPTEEANVSTALRLFDEGWGAQSDWDTIWREVMAPDVRSYFHAFPANEGVDAAITFNRELFAGFPHLEMTVVDVVAEGDAVIVRGRLTGAHEGPFLGVPATGATVDVPDVTMFRLRDGKVVETRYFTDLMAVMAAIGALP